MYTRSTEYNHQDTLQQFNQVVIIMGVTIKDNKLVIITEPKAIHFDLPIDANNNLKQEKDVIIKHNELLAEHTIKNEVCQLMYKHKHVGDIDKHQQQ